MFLGFQGSELEDWVVSFVRCVSLCIYVYIDGYVCKYVYMYVCMSLCECKYEYHVDGSECGWGVNVSMDVCGSGGGYVYE